MNFVQWIKRPQMWWYFIAAMVFVYLIFRALWVPLVHDEAATFFHYVHTGHFFPPKALWDANNHYLNTILTWLSYQIFGSSVFALRLPNLLGFLIFVFYLVQIATVIKSKFLQWALVLSLLFCHGFIEFFNVTRGYGLSMALIIAAIWYSMRFLETYKIKYQIFLIVFGFFALASNLTLLNSFIILLGYIQCHVFFQKKILGIKRAILMSVINLFAGGLILISAVLLLLKMKVLGLLYYGTLSGFVEFSLPSFLRLLFEQANPVMMILLILWLGLFCVALVYAVFMQKKIVDLINPRWIFPILLFGNWIAVLLMANLMQVNYPEDRTGLYFVLFFIGTLIFLIDELILQFKEKLIMLLALPLLVFPFDFINRANLCYMTIWNEDYIPARFYEKIADDKSSNPTIGGYFMRRLCFAYHNFQNGGHLNQVQCAQYPEYISDYQIVMNTDSTNWKQYYDSIDYATYSKLYLYKKKTADYKKTLLVVDSIRCTDYESEYFNLFEGSADTMSGKDISVFTSMSFASSSTPPVMWVVVSIDDSAGNNVLYEFAALHWKKHSYNGENQNLQCTFSISNVPVNCKRFVLYIWNIHKKKFSITDGQCVISEIKKKT